MKCFHYFCTYLKQVQRDIGPTMDIARGLIIQSTIENSSFLEVNNSLQNISFQNFSFYDQIL